LALNIFLAELRPLNKKSEKSLPYTTNTISKKLYRIEWYVRYLHILPKFSVQMIVGGVMAL
jgi:hypothetical protein